ncbi:MAG: type II toxin-antitoxin system VapC family toxin [Acidobacteria bacterium]|nr:type II toxin-antitoxin system VapC family toxin [Acidobacteriota bacterium]MCY4602405.1 type II toxin-antitoxin system VapC family toxin [Acidobacteriota bacterium]
MRLVLDTSVLIDHLRGRPAAATELIPSAIARGDELWSSYVVRAELLAGMRAEEETATRDLMRLVSWVEVDESISETAGALGRRYLRSHPGIEVADLIVAALVQELDAELKTTNLKHFPMFEELKAPY